MSACRSSGCCDHAEMFFLKRTTLLRHSSVYFRSKAPLQCGFSFTKAAALDPFEQGWILQGQIPKPVPSDLAGATALQMLAQLYETQAGLMRAMLP